MPSQLLALVGKGSDERTLAQVLGADSQHACLRRAVDAGLRGGALYDALIAATAREHGATLVSADRRARETYEAMGVDVSYVEP